VTLRGYIIVGVLALILLVLGTCAYHKRRADRAEARLAPAEASVKALDRVATETPIIRQDQAEKEREVQKIEGADNPLPSNFGRDLERVRRGQSNPDSRQP
jgi:hypothetical protein